jgi:hypothetical protein
VAVDDSAVAVDFEKRIGQGLKNRRVPRIGVAQVEMKSVAPKS